MVNKITFCPFSLTKDSRSPCSNDRKILVITFLILTVAVAPMVYSRIWLSGQRCVLSSIPTLSPFEPGGPGTPCNNMSITDHITWEVGTLIEVELHLTDIADTVFQNHFRDMGENVLLVLMILGDQLVLGDLGIHWLPIGKVMQRSNHESHYSVLPHYRH